MERDKFIAQGEKFGLEGDKLRAYVDGCVREARDERAAARSAEVAARNAEIEARKAESYIIAQRDEARKKESELLDKQIKLEELRKNNGTENVSRAGHSHKPSIPPLPVFQEGKDDLDSYLSRFEKHAIIVGWDRSVWAPALCALMSGKALDIISRLTVSQAQEYETVKSSLLKGYDLTEEGYRTKFRYAKLNNGETYVQYACRIEKYLNHWIELSSYDDNMEGLKSLLIQEQVYNSCGKELLMFIKERHPCNLSEVLNLADQFNEAHADMRIRRMNKAHQSSSKNVNPNVNKSNNNAISHTKAEKPGKSKFDDKKCFNCNKFGHISFNCPNKKGRREMGASVVAGRSAEDTSAGDDAAAGPTDTREMAGHFNHKSLSLIVQENLTEDGSGVKLASGDTLPVLSAVASGSEVEMPVVDGLVNGKPVDVLRDSGCTTVIVRYELVREEQFFGDRLTCLLVDRTLRNFRRAKIDIDTPYFKGKVEALCVPTPVYDLVLGNIPGARQPADPDGDWTPGDHQGSAVETRGQKRQAGRTRPPLPVPKPLEDMVSVDNLIQAQKEDSSLDASRKAAEKGEKKISKGGNSSCFFFKKDVLYREYMDATPGSDVLLQVVVPTKFRNQVLKLAHESILGGHLGNKKTCEKILMHFFWPGMHADVVRYCRSCGPCQRTSPKGKVTKVPLGSTPLIDEPFRRVAMDLVGPIEPASSKGNRFILTVVDYATRYPEAVALRRIDAQTVAEALMDIYSRVGIPREVLTDRGSQFTSELMKEVSRLLSIRQMTTTPYHPACNGLVERFNGTLKSMLRKMCEERPKDWERYLNPLLFAYRDSVQESTGFSPFELLYGRAVRGPLAILQELWTGEVDEPDTKTTYQYVLDLKERLESTCQLAQQNLSKSAEKYRRQYNKKAKERKFEVDDEVLLLPSDNNKLLMHWKGPFKVVQKVGPLDYKIDLDGKTKTFHANLLKKYYRRDST
ncbi:uncharacterized protein LOC121416935 [Lytechinus variegatus]|uniref:uncharacterized protein LOC121416935 n=1 Tax=Lytechinus variegatus TaxID=7654 RepID=UPI001BB21B5C|nr:uncharacterized protein LOC121416935 [Lytechinus variegatus]